MQLVQQRSIGNFASVSVMVWKYACAFGIFLKLYFVYYIPHHTIVAGYYGFTGCRCVCPSVCPSIHRQSVRLSVFHIRMRNLSKHQWIFTKLGMCIDIMEIWFGIAKGQILTALSARDMPIFSCPDDSLSKFQGILTKLGTCIDMKEIWVWITNGQMSYLPATQ